MGEPESSGDELLELAPRRLPRRIRAAAFGLALLAMVGTAGYALTRPGPARPHAAAPSAVARFDADRAVAFMAGEAGRLPTYVRSSSSPGACPRMPKTDTPHVVMAAIRHALPAYRLLDAGRVFDIYGGLCSIEVRAVDSSGSTLVLLSVGARRNVRPATSVSVAKRLGPATTVTRAELVLHTGWRVMVGVVGPVAGQPHLAAILRLARDSTLRW